MTRLTRTRVSRWPLVALAAPAFVAIWGGWVGLGEMAGFGEINLLPGIVAEGGWATINSAITLPIGVEAYAAYALRAWLAGTDVPAAARRFAKWSAIGALGLGALGQIAYHLLAAQGVSHAPWQITTLVACFPVAVLGMGAALAHLLNGHPEAAAATSPVVATVAMPEPGQMATVANPAIVAAPNGGHPDAATPTARPAKRASVATQAARRRQAEDTDTASRVAALHAKRPDVSNADAATLLGIGERTARRYLTPLREAAKPATEANGRTPKLIGDPS